MKITLEEIKICPTKSNVSTILSNLYSHESDPKTLCRDVWGLDLSVKSQVRRQVVRGLVLALRKALGESSLKMPIHIFGCLEPMSILAYFLCGADIFDGLAWLRFAFHNGIAIYRPNASVLQGLWKDDDENNWLRHSLGNLSELMKLSMSLTRFCETYDVNILDLPAEHASIIMALVNSAGVEL